MFFGFGQVPGLQGDRESAALSLNQQNQGKVDSLPPGKLAITMPLALVTKLTVAKIAIAAFLLLTVFSSVPAIAQITPTGPRLQTIAPKGFNIGGTMHAYWDKSYAADYTKVATDEFNTMTGTVYMSLGGWPSKDNSPSGSLQRADKPDTSGWERFVDWAYSRDKKVHGHSLVYPLVNEDSQWWMNLPANQTESVLKQYVQTLVKSRKGKVNIWDVTNEVMGFYGEPLDADGLRTEYKEYKDIGPDYVEKIFRWAHEADPDAILIMNENGLIDGGPKAERFLKYAIKLRKKGVPIHGVGIQAHFNDPNEMVDYLAIRKTLQRFADAGFNIYLNEMDVSSTAVKDPNAGYPNWLQELRQKEIFREVARIALQQPACKGLMMWDFADRHSWLHPVIFDLHDLNEGDYTFPAPFGAGDGYEIYPKPAYYGLQEAFQQYRDLYVFQNCLQGSGGFLRRLGVPSKKGHTASRQVCLSADADGSSAKWTFEKVWEGVFRIRCEWEGGSGYLTRGCHFENGAWTPNGNVALETKNDHWTSQMWELHKCPGGGFQIESHWGENGFLTFQKDPSGPHGMLKLQKSDPAPKQIWQVTLKKAKLNR